MSRNKSRGRNSNQIEVRRNRNDFGDFFDVFDNMERQMMRGFGGLDDDFFSGMMEDPTESMFNFSNLHQKMHNGKTSGAYICQSFVQSSKMGPDGKVITENYYENNLGQHRNGNTISEKQQAYRNSSGVQRIAEERMLNEKGRKFIKEKKGSEIEETNHYYNIDEEEAREFDEKWNTVNQQQGFLEEHGRYLGYRNSGQRAIGYDPNYDQPAPKRRRSIKNKSKRKQKYNLEQESRAMQSSSKTQKVPSEKTYVSSHSRNSKMSLGNHKI